MLSTVPAPKSELGELLKTVLGAVALAAFIMIFIARAFTVDGPSMLPTFHDRERVLVDKITYRFTPPKRGDVIVFRYPADPSEHFIKRVIGVPGDTVETKNGRTYLNGVPVDESYIAAPILGHWGPEVVPEGHYFVMGDNRNNSKDSRDYRVGFVPKKLITGRVLWRYWPLNRVSLIRPPAVLRAASSQP